MHLFVISSNQFSSFYTSSSSSVFLIFLSFFLCRSFQIRTFFLLYICFQQRTDNIEKEFVFAGFWIYTSNYERARVNTYRALLSNSQVMSIWPLGKKKRSNKREHTTITMPSTTTTHTGIDIWITRSIMENQVKIICKQIEVDRYNAIDILSECGDVVNVYTRTCIYGYIS